MSTSVSASVKSKVISIIILVVISLIFPVVLIEGAARLVPGLIPIEIKTVFQQEQDQPLNGLVPDEQLGYKYAPGLVDFSVPFGGNEAKQVYTLTTVSLGYEDVGFRDDGLEGDPFAVVIGDSFTACANVALEECWVELLEQGTGQDFANLGVGGYSPQQTQRMLTTYGLPLKPKVVIWTFFGNDMNDAWRFAQFGSGAAREGQFWQHPLRAWLARNSVVYPTLSFFWYNYDFFTRLAQADGELIPRDSSLVWWLTHTDLTVPELVAGLNLAEAAILTASEQLQAADAAAQFVIVILPFREQVYADPRLRPQLDGYNQALLEFGRQHDIMVLDLTPALREVAESQPPPLYFRNDIHLNRRGNEVVAHLLRQRLGPLLVE